MHRVHLMIQGRVQGVGFRHFAYRQASALAVNGWVRNLPGGEVEVEAEGGESALREFVSALRNGPVSARVTAIAEEWSESPSRHSRFAIL